MRMHWSSLLTVMSLGLGGCYAADLDETANALFACEVSGDADEADVDCPGELQCNGRVCVERLPNITVSNPEPLQKVPMGEERFITLQISGFTFSSDEDDADGGFIRVTLDEQTIDLRSGDISTGRLPIEELLVSDVPGAHRVSAQAFRPDGTPFENADASSAQVFWRDDLQPHVAITEPWPGSEFELQPNGLIDVEVAMVNFRFGQTDTELATDVGHIHVYYDDVFPECSEDPICDAGYIGVISAAPEEAAARPTLLSEGLLFPDSPVADATLTAVLRQNDHSVFIGPDGELDLVSDTVTIRRVAE